MIQFALDLVGKRVYIENAISGYVYVCEECGTRLIAKNKGIEKRHHFAHIPIENNKDLQRDCQRRSDSRTENQMSEWHPAWQEKYPLHQREVVFKKGDQVFRADICRKERREIIEFQHSRITNKDFHARNNFYNSIGYKVIWLFEFDQLNGKYQFMHPDQYDKFINDFVRNGQKVYVMDQNTYYSMFAEWKPQQNRKVSVYFMRTYQQWKFYSHIECVTGSFDYDMPMRLFVRDIKESDFLSRIGIKNNRI